MRRMLTRLVAMWVTYVSRKAQIGVTSSTPGTELSEHRSAAPIAPRRYLHGVALAPQHTGCDQPLADVISQAMRLMPHGLYKVVIRSDEATSSSGFVRVVVISESLQKTGPAQVAS